MNLEYLLIPTDFKILYFKIEISELALEESILEIILKIIEKIRQLGNTIHKSKAGNF